MLKGSWKTSATGIGMIFAGLGGLCAMIAKVMNEGVGVVDEQFIQGATLAIGSISGGVGLVFARDNNRSSEEVGAKDSEIKG